MARNVVKAAKSASTVVSINHVKSAFQRQSKPIPNVIDSRNTPFNPQGYGNASAAYLPSTPSVQLVSH
jgi:hypothetical protein